MPFAIYLLGLAVFAQGTSEFMLSGLVPGIAQDLHVSIPAAGALTSAFAVGMVVGAPLMAVLSLRWPRRTALLVFLAVFMVVHIVGAVTTDFGVLLATRAIGALANAGFLAVGMATATSMVEPHAKGRVISVLLSGVTLACVAGVPAGALMGQLWGWRSAFWAVALICAPVLIAVVRSVPGPAPAVPEATARRHAEVPSARRELRALRRPRLLVILLLGALVNGATFCTFTYLLPLTTQVSGFQESWTPVLLALFGLGSFLGVTVAGRMSDNRPMRLLVPGGGALLAGWLLFAVAADSPVAALLLLFVQGTLSFAVGSTLITRAVYAASGAPTLAGSFATAAFNVGAALGPAAGGAAIDAGLGFRSPLWVSALLVALAFAVAGLAHAVRQARGGPGETSPVI
ncbi:MFS transporter, DHA1 family, chloramphenicol resistance protein [Sinosporangium album]|uniref:MFS transporter, DHA1 family, chloramphenicol resistance protein n=1 Tax=Sinosporangium album TaxID=504805 RepID=A0A1G7T1G9_9ACTN|nr:Cmx/CmrA family chloramphenicol efflux MFS transporter [Sinosporangium album]SDG29143.1 MFS transporter, DHA1 family, chloramphenicol resistance protein [Sinosporangium album]